MTLLRFVVAVFYSLVGVSGGIAFMILKNYPAAILAVTTGILNIMLSYIHFLNYKNKLQDLYSPPHLRQIGTFGFFSFAISTSILIYFTVIEIMEKKPILPIHDSAIIPLIWAFIAAKSGLMLLYYARSYILEGPAPLTEEPVAETDDGVVMINP